MHISIGTGFWIAWGSLAAVWLATASWGKPSARRSSRRQRGVQSALILAGFLLIGGWGRLGWFNAELWPQTLEIAEAGMGVTFLGVFYAIWARLTLGSNWSGTPQVKMGHELVQSGPYRLTRHPIYSGMLLAAVGTAIAVDEWRCLPGLALVVISMRIKIRVEERLMTETFPVTYPIYRNRVKGLVPFLW